MASILLIACVAIGSCFATPTLIIMMLVGLYALYIAYVRKKYKSIPHPPFTNFFIGNGTELMLAKRNRHLLWLTWDKSYGPIFKICVLHRVTIMITSVELAKKICLNSNYPKARSSYLPLQTLFGERFMGKGLVTETNHSVWRLHRSIFNVSFYKNHLKTLLHVFNNKAVELADKIVEVGENGNKSFPLLDYLSRALMDVICEAGFSFKSGCLKDSDSPFPRAMHSVLRAISESFVDPLYQYKPWNWNVVKQRKEDAKFIRETGQELIRQKLQRKEMESCDSEHEEKVKDIMDMAIDQMGVGKELSCDVLLDDFVTLFVAGQETTANSLSFLVYLLSSNSDYLKKAQQEADEFIESELDEKGLDGSSITFEQIEQKLPYIGACWREALRLYPPAFGTVREIPKSSDATLGMIGGHKLPPGTDVAVNFIPIHYSTDIWGHDAAYFQPDRFLNSKTANYSFLAFSLGQRSCIGRHFAELEAKVLMLHLLHRFDFRLSLHQTFDVDEALTMRLYDRCQVRMIPRVRE